MDRDAMRQFAGSHFYSAEPLRHQMPNGGSGLSSSAEEELSSESTEDKPPRLHIMESGGGHFPMDDEDDSYGAGFPTAEDTSNNSSYGGAVPASAARFITAGTTSEDNGISSSFMKPSLGAVRYFECLKNHAANLGGHAVDGCGEFLPSGSDGIDALICAACGCHRNFHRREVEGEHTCSCKGHTNINANQNMNPNPRGVSGPPTPGMLAISASRDMVSHPQMEVSMSSLHYTDDLDLHSGSSSRKKRHRTKFSSEQKERMLYFAEKLGWRISKQHELPVQRFCDDVGVPRNVFKVWMHNNKHSFSKRMNTGETDLITKSESPSDY